MWRAIFSHTTKNTKAALHCRYAPSSAIPTIINTKCIYNLWKASEMIMSRDEMITDTNYTHGDWELTGWERPCWIGWSVSEGGPRDSGSTRDSGWTLSGTSLAFTPTDPAAGTRVDWLSPTVLAPTDFHGLSPPPCGRLFPVSSLSSDRLHFLYIYFLVVI